VYALLANVVRDLRSALLVAVVVVFIYWRCGAVASDPASRAASSRRRLLSSSLVAAYKAWMVLQLDRICRVHPSPGRGVVVGGARGHAPPRACRCSLEACLWLLITALQLVALSGSTVFSTGRWRPQSPSSLFSTRCSSLTEIPVRGVPPNSSQVLSGPPLLDPTPPSTPQD